MRFLTIMPKQEIIDILQAHEGLLKSAQAIAVRWVRAQNAGYTWATPPTIDLLHEKVHFFATPSTSGVGLAASFPLRFLWDDTGLEESAREQYRIYKEARDALCKERDGITAASTQVRLAQIDNQLQSSTLDNPTGNAILGSPFNYHLLNFDSRHPINYNSLPFIPYGT